MIEETAASAARDALRARLDAEGLDWIVPAWAAPGNVVAVSTTKTGGASGAFDAGPSRIGDAAAPGRIVANRARLASFLPAAPVYLHQVHGTTVVAIDGDNLDRARADPPQADAAVTRTPGIALAVRAADCLPVLFADRAGSVVAAAHAGWRGLAGGVLEASLTAMGVASRDIVAWIGPAIGPHAFEVGREVLDACGAADASDAECFAPLAAGKWLGDLPGLARRRLARAGVHDVAGGAWCTVRDASRFHSWRRERSAGRMATAIAIVPR
jgi:YfiH family protein